jgi:predicted Na+-dependent transporter
MIGLLIVIGEFLICCLVVTGSVIFAKSHPRIVEFALLAYCTFIVCSYFIARWKYELLRKRVMKFKKTRRKFLNFEFGLPNPPAKSHTPAPKKSK